jgi:hypothetical protein
MITANEVEGTDAVLASIRRFADITGASLSEEIIRTARLVAVSVAHSTQPYGKDAATKETGERRVKNDIARVFTTPSAVFGVIEKKSGEGAAKRFWSAHKAGDNAAMKQIMDRESLGLAIIPKPEKSIHQARRSKSSGRVTSKHPSHMVTDTRARDRYIAERQKKVGFAKSGWATAADACGGHRGIPQWASSRHKGRAPGGAIIERDSVHPRVVLFNNVSYIDQVSDFSQINAAVDIAYEKLFKRIQILISKGYADSRLKAA